MSRTKTAPPPEDAETLLITIYNQDYKKHVSFESRSSDIREACQEGVEYVLTAQLCARDMTVVISQASKGELPRDARDADLDGSAGAAATIH